TRATSSPSLVAQAPLAPTRALYQALPTTRARHPQILQITQARLPPNPAHLRAIAQVAPTLIRATASASALLPLPQPRRPQASPGPSAPQIAHLHATAWAQMDKVTSGIAPASPNRPGARTARASLAARRHSMLQHRRFPKASCKPVTSYSTAMVVSRTQPSTSVTARSHKHAATAPVYALAT